MPTNTSGGTTTSFSNTPQGNADYYTFSDDELYADSRLYNRTTHTLSLDVMSNDLGGNSKSLYSIDDGDPDFMQKLLESNVTTGWEPTDKGNWIRICQGKIEFRLDDGSGTNGSALDVATLDKGDVVSDSFYYAIRLGNGTLAQAKVSVTVTGTNDGPTANADTASSTENQVLTVDVLANDTDPDASASLTVTAATAPIGKGSASIVGNKVVFDPGTDFDHLAAGVTEQVVIQYTMSDEHGSTSSSTLTITVTGTNDAPIAVADTGATTENATVDVDVLANDDDVDDGAVLTIVSASASSGEGSASVVDGKVRFDPGTDFDHLAKDATATVTVSYTIEDEHGAQSTSTVEITVTGTNDGPVASADTATGHENQTLTINVIGNDTDADDGAVLTLTLASAPAGQGAATIVANELVFTPGTDFDDLAVGESELVTVNYTIADEHGATSNSSVTITVTGTNDGPVANADTGATSENAAVLVDVLANDTDVDTGAVLTIVSAWAPSGEGSASVVGGKVRFDPGADFDHLAKDDTAAVTVSYTIEDEHGAQSTSTVEITVTGTNDGPVATADTGATTENAAVDVDVLANDDDVDDGAVLTIVSASAPSGEGSASVVGGKVRFDPGSDFDHLAKDATAKVTVTYVIEDEHGAQSTSTVEITVTGTNDGPVATADTGATTENAAVDVDVLANDDDVDDGAVLTIVSASAPTGEGSASVVGGKVRFDPGSDFDHLAKDATAKVTVTYVIEDEHGAQSTSTVEITVTGTNDGPVASADSNGTDTVVEAGVNASNVTVAGDPSAAGNVLGNDSDADDGADLSVAKVNGSTANVGESVTGTYGSVVISADGTWAYTLNNGDADTQALDAGQVVTDVFSYIVTDEQGATSTANLTITITGTNDAPALTGIKAALPAGMEDVDYTVSATDLLAGYSDVDDTVLAVAGLTADYGTVTDNGDGTYTIEPDADYAGTVTLSYSVIDGHGGAIAATQTFNLAAVNDPAVIGGTDTGDVYEATASDAGTPATGGTLTISDVDSPATFQPAAATTTYGSYTINQNGQWTYTLNNTNPLVNALVAGAILVDSFIVYSDDATAHTVEITIHGADDVVVVSTPTTYTGADPNDFDLLTGGAVVSGNFTASNSADTFTGDSGNQTLNGQGGNDTIYGQAGNDNINGNNDNDTLYGQVGIDTLSGNGGDDTLYGGSGDDILNGNNEADILFGGSGNDTLTGLNDDDILIGGFGMDTLTGGGGNDTFKYLDIRDTNDIITDFMVSGSDFIDLSGLYDDPATMVNDALAWGGTTPTAKGAWYAEGGGNTTLYVDTDGNTSTAELMVTLQGFTGWGTSYDQPIEGPPPGVIL